MTRAQVLAALEQSGLTGADAETTLDALRAKLDGSSEREVLWALQEVFGADAVRAVLVILRAAVDAE